MGANWLPVQNIAIVEVSKSANWTKSPQKGMWDLT